MTAVMLVLEPIFEADLPPEQYAYRPGRNAQQAVVKVEELLFRGHPEVVLGHLRSQLKMSIATRIRKNKAGGTLSQMAQVILAIRDRTGRPLC